MLCTVQLLQIQDFSLKMLRDPGLVCNVKRCLSDIHSGRFITDSCQLLTLTDIVLQLSSAQAFL